jgi:N-acetylglucosamine kinase-like BadF-type ATPase
MKRRLQIVNVVGVDAGGTKTTAVLARGDKTVRTASGGSANPSLVGVDGAAGVILRAIREACGARKSDSIAAIYVGAAGAGSVQIARELQDIIAAAYPKPVVRVGDDVEIALRAAIPHGPGIVVIAGTGSIALAIDARGAQHRAGGFGYLLGDEGSAAWIGFEAVRLLSRVYDGRARDEETSRLVARHLAAPDRPSLIRAVYGERVNVAEIAALAPSIIAFAGKGNRASLAIVESAAEHLARLVIDVAAAATLTESKPVVAFSGGLLCEEHLLVTLLRASIAASIPNANIVSGAEPVLGAVRLASALAAEH